MLSPEELVRYSRHLLLPEVGEAGQARLQQSSVVLIGTGGLGSPLALYLAAAGVGRIGLVDFDRVDLSNLHRQVLHGTSDVGRSKLASAQQRLTEINPHVRLDLHDVRLSAKNAIEVCQNYDVIVDGTDNFATRYLVNDVSYFLDKPNVYGSIQRFEGQVSVFHPDGGGPCYRCLYPEPPPPGLAPSCAEAGVLGVLPGIIGTLQATECLKLLLGIGEPLRGRLLLYDALRTAFREVRFRRDPKCALCGDEPTLTGLIDYDEFCGTAPAADEVSADDLRTQLATLSLLDVRERWEWENGHLEAVHLPLGDLPARIHELDAQADWVVYCQSGKRSAQACSMLRQHGFGSVRSLRGGLQSWGPL